MAHGPFFLRPVAEHNRRKKLPASNGRPKTGKKIVIVDDTETLRLFRRRRAFKGRPGITNHNGSYWSGWNKNRAPPSLILSYSITVFQISMVTKSASDFCKNEQTARIPVLMMSGHVPEMIATAARFENIVATIEKPFLSQALVDLVQRRWQPGQDRPYHQATLDRTKPKT